MCGNERKKYKLKVWIKNIWQSEREEIFYLHSVFSLLTYLVCVHKAYMFKSTWNCLSNKAHKNYLSKKNRVENDRQTSKNE